MENVREVSDLSIFVVTSTRGVSQRPCARSSAQASHGAVVKKTNNISTHVATGAAVTYAALEAHLSQKLWGDAPPVGQVPTQVRNMRTQLNAWMTFVGKTAEDEIGAEFGGEFEKRLTAFATHQTKLGRKPSVVRDRVYAISRFRGVYRRLATSALPSSFAGAVDALIVASNMTCAEVARRAGLSDVTLGLWRRGQATPSIRHNRVAELEQALGAAAGTLACRLPRTSLPTNRQVLEEAPTTPFRNHMRDLQHEPQYVLRYITQALQGEWGDLLKYKTTPLPDLSRHARAVWSAKPASMCRVLGTDWCWQLPDGRRVQTAYITWSRVSHYLGWLTLAEKDGGPGISPHDVQTLAWLAVPQLVERYMRWSAERCGAFNSHTLSYLNTACSLLSPRTGYLNQCDAMRDRLPQTWRPSIKWRTHCDDAYRHLNALRLKLASSIRLTRDPESAIRDILARPDPVMPLLTMLNEMERAMPPTSAPHDRAVMMRDILFVGMLIANPLRVTQYMTLQVGSGTDENLYKDAAGRWCLRFAPEHVKNARFRPKRQRARAYNVPLADWVVPLLERYLEHARPVLLKGHRSPYLLVGQLGRHVDMNAPFSNLDDRLQLLTARYIRGSAGFRGHAFRHIVATAWLKAHPRDYLTVARMLDDKLETVIEVYAHLEIGDCLDEYSRWVKTLRKS